MIPEDIETLALADAIGALDADEQRELRTRLEALSAEIQAEVAVLYDVASLVGASIEPIAPPPHLRERVLAAARQSERYTVPADAHAGWSASPIPGIEAKVLSINHRLGLATLLIRASPGAIYPAHRHSGPEECYVIRGSVTIDGRVLLPGDFHHADQGSEHGDITTTEGAEVLIVGAIADYLPS